MLAVSMEQMQQQVKEISAISSTPSIIYFDDFVKSLVPHYTKGNLPDEIKIAKDEDALLAGDFEPAYVINIKDNLDILEYKGLPMWHNTSNDQFSLHGLGLVEGNKSSPSAFTLFDTNPHINIGGATGHGKSVLGNDILIASSLVHPPWLAQYYLSDPKIVELKPYATAEYQLPHVDAVAATEDPEYAISVLEHVLAKMDKRAAIFDRMKVKNIDSFNKTSGLVMPMMIVVLDELKAMLQTAGRRAAHVDKLIQAFVAKARFAGGRCIMLSQGVVTELDPATLKNVNIRV
ncbi:FtsK/SpoIIIE domain-containing protein, partial [Lysinibacillus xylanilyticus]|uniref:FtsK/SpoIIIE domain-containing protein n=1 Tax=Lysinibacillus xylanilyticus TaxID=582475 RepID=UPI0036D92244